MRLPLQPNIPEPGILVLAGSGEYLPGMESVDRYLLDRLDGPVNVICLPTGAGTESKERIQYWMELGINYYTGLGVANVEALCVTDRASAMDESMVERIRQVNYVYLSGGKPTYLFSSLKGTPVFDAIRGVLERGGVVAGCSAGAMIFAERIPGSPFPWSWQEGFNFLPGTILVPHFDELPQYLLSGIIPLAGKYTIVGIEGYTALVCNSQGAEVRGKGGVTLINHGKRTRFVQEE